MRILFVMRTTVYVRNFESTLRLLAERGHQVHVVAEPHEIVDPTNLMGRLCRVYPRITHGLPPAPSHKGWSLLGEELRRGVDYLRYLGPEYAGAPKLRARGELSAPGWLRSLVRRTGGGSRPARRILTRGLRWCDRALPVDPGILNFVRQQSPDLVLVTPLVEPGSPQAAYLRSARALGIRTGLCVYSWDNLTNKGLIQDPLDVVTVWNEPMKQEAVALHGVAADRVIVTGAPAYDHWFEWKPSTSRAAFCARVGLRADRPYVLYLCSSKFIAPDEVAFIRQWVEKIRTASDVLRDAGVLVRRHPQNLRQWRGVALNGLDEVVIWPAAGGNPVDEESRATYYDSIHHSAAVVGVNTSAQIESAIVGRAVYTVLAPQFRETQEGTLHFRHLQEVSGGLLHVGRDFAEHVAQLAAAVRHPEAHDDRCRRFVEAFVRPHGLNVPATPKLVDALEAVLTKPAPPPERARWWAWVLRRGLATVASRRERAAKERAEQERMKTLERLQAWRQEKAAARAAKERVEAPIQPDPVQISAAFDTYLMVREQVSRMRASAATADASLSETERRMLAAIEPMWHATPEMIANLRRQCAPITGVDPAAYDRPADAATKQFWEETRKLLREGGEALLVPESRALGGFGHSRDAKLYNDDTLKFYEVLAALKLGAVLNAFHGSPGAGQRGIVWEIGGGWGGFAYQFKTLCPNVTYIITGHPALFLFSAVYLMTVFPKARCRFQDDVASDGFWRDIETADFVFLPESVVTQMRPPRVDLTLDLMALEHISAERRRVHVQHAFDVGSRYFYSLCPSVQPVGSGVCAVRPLIEQRYWSHVIPVPRLQDANAWIGLKSARAGVSETIGHSHVIGWRRLLT